MTRTYHIATYGCQMNEHDTERIAGLLEADGMAPADDLGTADVVVLNTCCIRENADNKLYAKLGDLKVLKTENPTMQIAVGGCLAQKDRDEIRDRAGHVDVVFGTHNVHRAAELLGLAREHGPQVEVLEAAARDDNEAFPSALPARREVDYAAWVTIQVGCDNGCAFCIVPAVRGPELSRPFDDLVGEAQRLADDGVTEITLLGQNVNSYGRDLTLAARQNGEDTKVRPLFAELLRAVGAVPGIERVRYTSPHPKDLRPETIRAMAETPSVCNHLHLPVQSGSDAVLAAMHRGYTGERYLDRINLAKATIADLAITTDLIVGFPGETDADHQQTMALVAEVGYDTAFIYLYSPRPGTEAEKLTNIVPHDVAVRRLEQLREIVQRSSALNHASRVGRTERVLVEGLSKRDATQQSGRTSQYKLVHFPVGDSGPLRPGTYVDVHIRDAARQYLLGELIEVVATPKTRVRIPVVAV